MERTKADKAATRNPALPKAQEETGGAIGAMAIQSPPPAFMDGGRKDEAAASGFTPIVYMKRGCPYCFKLRLALLESGVLAHVVLREFEAHTPEENAVRDLLSRHVFSLSFPVAETAPGRFTQGSDVLIHHFLEPTGKAPQQLEVLQAYLTGPFALLTP